ncbi:Pyrroline-5-carboxylate reductase 3 [Chionoecetes opilio]|uniref:Pyrroline-5-carboxylate reductase n=1 Tax=Chionoecetes opilio TaxID=41210 RepID=A0A8J5BU44_CHIOP|nr:Pyrroline-5-carboxylate reductase 3 [Chionoecetes opilio]
MASLKIGFIGAGNMAQALAKGFISSGLAQPQHLVAACPPADRHLLQQMESLGCATTHENREAAATSDVVVMCVKPVIMGRVLHDLRPCVTSTRPLVTSVALGVTLATMEAALPPRARVVRIMPNTPALVQLGASVFSRGNHATQADAELTHRMLTAVGQCDEVPESFLDAVTGLSGAGPAYMYLVVEALADGGVRMGLPRGLAQRLAAQTMMGAAKMVLSTGKHPGQLKDEVCSPGGCTIQGVQVLEDAGLRSALISAVHTAAAASVTMGKVPLPSPPLPPPGPPPLSATPPVAPVFTATATTPLSQPQHAAAQR